MQRIRIFLIITSLIFIVFQLIQIDLDDLMSTNNLLSFLIISGMICVIIALTLAYKYSQNINNHNKL